jgi:hypothetical protein
MLWVKHCVTLRITPLMADISAKGGPNQYSEFKDFLDTKLPIFKEAKEPLQADKWQNILEQKFHLLRVIVGIS